MQLWLNCTQTKKNCSLSNILLVFAVLLIVHTRNNEPSTLACIVYIEHFLRSTCIVKQKFQFWFSYFARLQCQFYCIILKVYVPCINSINIFGWACIVFVILHHKCLFFWFFFAIWFIFDAKTMIFWFFLFENLKILNQISLGTDCW